MTFSDYQQAAHSTSLHNHPVIYPTLGLTGESGEVADKVKKVIRDHDGQFTPEIRHAVALELGDVLWYIQELAGDLGYTMEQIAQMNIEKLQSRQQRNVIHGNGDDR